MASLRWAGEPFNVHDPSPGRRWPPFVAIRTTMVNVPAVLNDPPPVGLVAIAGNDGVAHTSNIEREAERLALREGVTTVGERHVVAAVLQWTQAPGHQVGLTAGCLGGPYRLEPTDAGGGWLTHWRARCRLLAVPRQLNHADR